MCVYVCMYIYIYRVLPALSVARERVEANRSTWELYDDDLLLEEVGQKATGEGACKTLRVASWNIAAVNNNPFEYWVTHGQTCQSEGYAELMTNVQILIDEPEAKDFKVCEVFTDELMHELVEALKEHKCAGVESLLGVWEAEYKNRYAIREFLKDKDIGSKRLISMPDRISNTIQSEGVVLMRPSVVSMFNDEALSTTLGWWGLWKKYMFDTQV